MWKDMNIKLQTKHDVDPGPQGCTRAEEGNTPHLDEKEDQKKKVGNVTVWASKKFFIAHVQMK